MRFLVDKMPDNKKDCPFFVGTCFVDDCTIVKDYCSHIKKSCDLRIEQKWPICCSGLDEVREYD